MFLGVVQCSLPELCTSSETSFGFFSKGDCELTDAVFFQGHEWITYLGNRDLSASERFTEREIHAIADGNRRVDWPKELLVHLNGGLYHYVRALTEHTDRPENQRLHFLLTDVNDSREAADDSIGEIRRSTIEALERWNSGRERALALLGRAHHILQDSFSAAHTHRNRASDWCILSVKAYIERASGRRDGIQYHGGKEGDTIGHTTTQDSIYREGRDCHDPVSQEEVEACLSDYAQRARLATQDYLRFFKRALALYIEGGSDGLTATDAVDELLPDYVATHLYFCE